MRIGVLSDHFPYYRAQEPMKAMLRRGHEVVWPAGGDVDFQALARCDVVHVYRLHGEEIRRMMAGLVRGGTPITYDIDDNLAALVITEQNAPGLGGHRLHARTVKMARLAHTFTTTTEVLAEQYRRSGVKRTVVIDNYLAPDVARPRIRHRGIVIGWVAGIAHQEDADRLGIADALRRIVDEHDNVSVECIGVDLALPRRYTHDPRVRFEQLPQRMGGWDIGIAPITPMPVNLARSNIKVKEYAASGVPWLASPIGPYASLGPEQGGRLVPDGGWFDALDALVRSKRERRALSRAGLRWAATQTMDAGADQWERVFAEASASRRTR